MNLNWRKILVPCKGMAEGGSRGNSATPPPEADRRSNQKVDSPAVAGLKIRILKIGGEGGIRTPDPFGIRAFQARALGLYATSPGLYIINFFL